MSWNFPKHYVHVCDQITEILMWLHSMADSDAQYRVFYDSTGLGVGIEDTHLYEMFVLAWHDQIKR